MQVKDLKPAGYNPRKISKTKLNALKKSLEEFGDLSGIVFNIRTQTLIGGHQRTKNLDPSILGSQGGTRARDNPRNRRRKSLLRGRRD